MTDQPRIYQIKSGRYAGMWHVRLYVSYGKYFHIGRFRNKSEADVAMRMVHANS